MKVTLMASVLMISLSAMAPAQRPNPASTPAAAAHPSIGANLFARIEVKTGRAQVIQAESQTQSIRQGESASLQGSAHLEVPVGSEVRLAYPGQASLHVWGPASLDWQMVPGQGSQTSIAWNIFQVTWCDLEVRRGAHRLHLPGDWSARLEGGSLRLRGLATGPLEMRLNAGRPVRVYWSGDRAQARPPMTILPGSNIRLEQPSQVKTDLSGSAPVWDRSSWPYARQSDTEAQRLERSQRRERLEEAPAWPMPVALGQTLPEPAQEAPRKSAPERPVRVDVMGETQAQVPVQPEFQSVVAPLPVVQAPGASQPESTNPLVSPHATGSQTEIAPQAQELGSQGNMALQKPVSEASQTVAFDRSQWRNIAQNKIKDCGVLAVEQRKGVEVRVFAGGKTKVLIDRWVGTPTWVMDRFPGLPSVPWLRGRFRRQRSHGVQPRSDGEVPRRDRPSPVHAGALGNPTGMRVARCP